MDIAQSIGKANATANQLLEIPVLGELIRNCRLGIYAGTLAEDTIVWRYYQKGGTHLQTMIDYCVEWKNYPMSSAQGLAMSSPSPSIAR